MCNAFILDTEELCAELTYSNTLCQQEWTTVKGSQRDNGMLNMLNHC